MKILLLNYEFPPLGGGAGNATSYLIKEFSRIPEIEIDLVTSSTGEFRIEKKYPNVTIHYLDIGKKGNLHYQSQKDLLTYSWKAYSYSKKLMAERDYDLCHAFFGIPCGFIAMLLGIPYIVSLRGSDVPFYNNRFLLLDKLLFQRISKKVWKNSKKVVALSHDLKDLARKTSPQQDISVVYNGIDTQEFFPNLEVRDRQETINILFVGRLIERKGFEYLLEAFKNIAPKYPKARLLVAGSGPLQDKFQQHIEDNKLQDRVKMLGIVTHDKINELYQKSHIFVLPSLNEALGNVTQEALAAGLPIITTKTGASEIASDNCILIERKSSKDIETALATLLDDGALRNRMSEESRKLSEKMDWSAIAQAYLDIFKEACSKEESEAKNKADFKTALFLVLSVSFSLSSLLDLLN